MSSKIRCAIVGVGNRSHCWVRGIVEQHPEAAELAALCDLNIERCHDINRYYGTSAAVFENYDQMLAEAKPDLVMVTSPEAHHAEHISKALDAGCEVATEKPLCVTFDHAKQILDAEKRNHRHISMCFNYRYIPLMTTIKNILSEGTIGRPVSMDLTWYLDYRGHGASYFRRWHRKMALSGGLLITKACHHFDLANWWMNDTPDSVYAIGKQNFFGPGKNPFSGTRCSECGHADECEWFTDVCMRDATKELSQELGYKVKGVREYIRDCCPFADDVDIHDTMGVMVNYRDGGILNYTLNASVPFEGWNLAINGTNGRIESKITDNKPSPGWQQKHRIVMPDGKLADSSKYFITDWPAEYSIHVMPHDRNAFELKLPNIAEGHGGGDFKLFDILFTDDNTLLPTAIDGVKSSAIGAAANQSIQTGKPVEIGHLFHSENK